MNILAQAGPGADPASAEVIAAIITAGVAVAIALLAPILSHWLEMRRARNDRRMLLLGRIQGLGVALGLTAQRRASAQRNRHIAGLAAVQGDTRFQEHNLRDHHAQRDAANAALAELATLHGQLHEACAEAVALFRGDARLVAAQQQLPSGSRLVEIFDHAPEHATLGGLADWAQNVNDGVRAAVHEQYERPVEAFVHEMRRLLGLPQPRDGGG